MDGKFGHDKVQFLTQVEMLIDLACQVGNYEARGCDGGDLLLEKLCESLIVIALEPPYGKHR